jgi:hypothetical protein
MNKCVKTLIEGVLILRWHGRQELVSLSRALRAWRAPERVARRTSRRAVSRALRSWSIASSPHRVDMGFLARRIQGLLGHDLRVLLYRVEKRIQS